MHKRSTRKITVPHCKMCLAAIVGVQMASASASKVHQPSRLRAQLALVKDVTRNGRNTRFWLFPLIEVEASLRHCLNLPSSLGQKIWNSYYLEANPSQFIFWTVVSFQKFKISTLSWPTDDGKCLFSTMIKKTLIRQNMAVFEQLNDQVGISK